MSLNYTVSVTRVIIVTHTDGEMFVSRDYNYNHSVILKLNSVVFEWPACWNQFTVLLYIFPNLIGTDQHTITRSIKVSGTQRCNLFSDHEWTAGTKLPIGRSLQSWSLSWLVSGSRWWCPQQPEIDGGPRQAVRMSSGLWSRPHGGKLIYQFKPWTLLKEPPSG